MRECLTCALDYQPVRVDQKYCSARCKDNRPRQRPRYKTRACEVCGVEYSATYAKQRTCGRACGLLIHSWAKSDGNREHIAAVGERTRSRRFKFRGAGRGSSFPFRVAGVGECARCGRFFPGRMAKRFCSQECRDRSYRPAANPRNGSCPECGVGIDRGRTKCDLCVAETVRQAKRRRKARKRSVLSEPYTLAEIASRDRRRCGLCRQRVDMSLVVPHFGAPTIDHIIPLARGGDDTRVNVQLAHFICNSTKGDRVAGEQLALVG